MRLKNCFGVFSYILITFVFWVLLYFCSIMYFWVPGGGGLNPTTVMVVLLLGLWWLLGCDNKLVIVSSPGSNINRHQGSTLAQGRGGETARIIEVSKCSIQSIQFLKRFWYSLLMLKTNVRVIVKMYCWPKTIHNLLIFVNLSISRFCSIGQFGLQRTK